MEYKGGELNGELNDAQKATLAFIREHPGCKSTQISSSMSIPFSTIDMHIRSLLYKGLIEHRGSKKRWMLRSFRLIVT